MCEHCRGNGAEPGTPIETCPRCQGRGQLSAVTRTPFGQVMRTTACDVCHGDGRVARDPCKVCRGRGRKVERPQVKVDVPAGIADGQRIRIAGRGHAGERGGPPGDLYVLIHVREDSRFVRDGDDLVTAVDVAAPLAALGTTVQVDTVDGERRARDPGRARSRTRRLIVRGAGMPSLRGRHSGNLRVLVNVVIPRHLSKEQRELVQQLADSMTEHNLRSDEGVFGKLKRAFGGYWLPDAPSGGSRPARAGRDRARRAARAGPERSRGGVDRLPGWSSTRCTGRRASCRRCRT